MTAFTEGRRRRKAPVAVFIADGCADDRPVIADSNKRIRLGNASKRWSIIVGQLPGGQDLGCTNVVRDCHNRGGIRHQGIDNDLEITGWISLVACGICCASGKDMVAFSQRSGRGKTPESVAVYRGSGISDAIIVKGDGCPRFAGSVKRRA